MHTQIEEYTTGSRVSSRGGSSFGRKPGMTTIEQLNNIAIVVCAPAQRRKGRTDPLRLAASSQDVKIFTEASVNVRLASVCQRAGVDPATANRAFLLCVPWPAGPWAKEIEIENQHYVVVMGDDPRFFVVFPVPFPGHSDQWKVIPPLRSANELLALLQS